MTSLTENDLVFDFSAAQNAVKFDDNALHLSSTIKRVDFIAEYTDKIVFLEVKDPDIPGAANVGAFISKLQSGKLITELAAKYRDSHWYRLHSGHAGKPIHYVVLLAMASLDPALLLVKQDQLKSAIPITHQNWSEPCAQSCIILNFAKYQEYFGAYAVRRRSAGN